MPWIVETSAGADRAAFTFLIDAYREEEVRGETRVVLSLHHDLAPYKVAVLPLLKKRPEIVELCHRIRDDLKRDVMAVYDDTASIGKLYRRQDEIGTPYCVTVDVDSLEDRAVTVRDRDSMEQVRVPVEGIRHHILDRLDAGPDLTNPGPDAARTWRRARPSGTRCCRRVLLASGVAGRLGLRLRLAGLGRRGIVARQVGVDGLGGALAVAHGEDDGRGAADDVAAGEDARHAGHAVLVDHDVAPLVELQIGAVRSAAGWPGCRWPRPPRRSR